MKSGMLLLIKADVVDPSAIEAKIKMKLQEDFGVDFKLSVLVVPTDYDLAMVTIQST